MRHSVEKASYGDKEEILSVLEHFNMHHVPSVEMEELDLSRFFVAKVNGHIIGVAGWKVIGDGTGKATLMGVLPDFNGYGIGKELQHQRMEVLYNAGCKTIRTNADRPEVILWYKKHFGYKVVGSLKKLCSFGLENVDHWTTLESDLVAYFDNCEENNRQRLEYMAQHDAYPLAPYPPLIINVCLTGMIPSKLMTPHVPITIDEIIEDAVRVYDAGARVVHLHARDESGRPTPDVTLYEKMIRGIRRERPDMICCATTSGRNWPEFERRSAVLYLDEDARPDMASLTTGSMNFITNPSINSIQIVERLAIAMKEQGVKPELEVFDLGMINLIKYLERNRIVEGRKYINILLGNINTAPASISGLSAMVEALPENSTWAGAGLGVFQLPVNTASIIAGGHVRVGIEDNIYYDYDKKRLATNVELVERICWIAGELQRRIATPNEARALMGLGMNNGYIDKYRL